MPSAMRGILEEMKTGGIKPARGMQTGGIKPSRPRDFVAPRGMAGPEAAPPGRPRSATRALMEEAMARGGVRGPRMGGIKPQRFETATESPALSPAAAPAMGGQAQYGPAPQSPMGGGNPQWFPQLDPAKVRRAQFGQWFNHPGAPQPDLGESGPMFNPMLGRWVR